VEVISEGEFISQERGASDNQAGTHMEFYFRERDCLKNEFPNVACAYFILGVSTNQLCQYCLNFSDFIDR
jgi:hypothetical protein